VKWNNGNKEATASPGIPLKKKSEPVMRVMKN
jgi:hypothetical protein